MANTYLPFSGAPKFCGTKTVNPASIDPQTLSTQSFAIPHIRVTDIPLINLPELPASSTIRLISARIPSLGTLEITFFNYHATDAEDLAAQPMHYVII